MKYLFSIIIISILIGSASIATAQVCDNNLKAVDNPLTAYQLRSQRRCEGYYRSKVSSGSLDIVGLTHGHLSYELASETRIPLSAPLATQAINIRAVGIKLKTYYRMDGVIPLGSKLDWPLKDVVYQKKLSDREVGLYGWFNDGKNKTYVPINFGESGDVVLTLRSSTDLSKVQWRFAETVGQACSTMGKFKKIKQVTIKRGKAFKIYLPASPTGKLCLEVAGKIDGSSRWLKLIERVQVVSQ
ncbi:hypothetical protein QUF61_15680 [Candidatus Venteria ishoeyi]|uniref:hypothetical protein n=1 Tax=Candidatus Venteria ishoeyi TaxID=1899563 RepID=UPI0025A5D3D9|nr:hypothetical protein [Candidatus Venteria ishoeyi]MDM8547928.1 hypothetical protein [Candidatus Venteria ishoeyi]